MAYMTFAAIDVGSNDVTMKIFQITQKSGIQQLDYVSSFLEMGIETYRKGKLSYVIVERLCEVLNSFKIKMKEYNVKDYIAYATSAVREASNREMIINQVKIETGINLEVLSNSEHRYLMYKAIALKEKSFNDIIQKNTAIVDIGAGSIQISMFDKQMLYMTQNIRIGAMRIREMLRKEEIRDLGYHEMVEDYVENEMKTFQNYFLKEKQVKHIIAIGDEMMTLKKIVPELELDISMNSEQMHHIYQKLIEKTPEQLFEQYGIPVESASLFLPAVIVCMKFLDNAKAETVFTPAIDLCDGIVADYAEKSRKIKMEHDFEEDILAAAHNIAKRYKCNKIHVDNVCEIAEIIFDKMKKIHGLDKRKKLLLKIAAILHDCGKYINMNNGSENSYMIIMSTEIIGLSHSEREIIANVVKYNTVPLPSYTEIEGKMKCEDYLVIAKLTAILRVANALDRSHKQKVNNISIVRKENEIIMTVDTLSSLSLEKALFTSKADFFEEVYGIRPILKQRRKY